MPVVLTVRILNVDMVGCLGWASLLRIRPCHQQRPKTKRELGILLEAYVAETGDIKVDF
jgi:hypothetical protein